MPYAIYAACCRTVTYACSESQNQNMPIYIPVTFVSPWVNCCDCRPFDDFTWAVEALLRLPKSWLRRELKYKYYVHAGKGIDQKYEHLAHTLGDPRNRCLKPTKSYTWDRRGESSSNHILTMSCVTCVILYIDVLNIMQIPATIIMMISFSPSVVFGLTH